MSSEENETSPFSFFYCFPLQFPYYQSHFPSLLSSYTMFLMPAISALLGGVSVTQ